MKADPELMRRVLANLIDNAAEAMEGSTMRQMAVSTQAESDGDAVEIEISDSGHGISPEDKLKLFLPHFSTKERGTGLGLAIASRIVAEHNGTIRVEDNLPAGTRFVIRFPAAEADSRCNEPTESAVRSASRTIAYEQPTNASIHTDRRRRRRHPRIAGRAAAR